MNRAREIENDRGIFEGECFEVKICVRLEILKLISRDDLIRNRKYSEFFLLNVRIHIAQLAVYITSTSSVSSQYHLTV